MVSKLVSVPFLGYSKIESDRVAQESVRFSRLLAYKVRQEAKNRLSSSAGYIEHFGVHRPRNNAGDTVLFDAIQELFKFKFGNLEFRNTALRKNVQRRDVSRINDLSKAVLVGGGGLLIEDSNPNSESGWQWRISEELLGDIEVPLLAFAIGYNLFRNDRQPSELMVRHISKTIEKSAFFGMRNTGSINKTKGIVPIDLHSKIVFQPCMTTVLSEFYPGIRDITDINPFEKRVALNLAFDRAERRFGEHRSEILERVGSAIETLAKRDWKIDLTLHGWDDEPAIEFCRSRSLPVNPVYLNLCSPSEIVRYYSGVPVTVGMRGHAQMIPFGCGNCIFSLISHDKLGYFLDDIGHRDWGVDIFDVDLSERIVEFVCAPESEIRSRRRAVEDAKSELWERTLENLNYIAPHLK